ncbi:DNA helicase [Spirochaetia bacterium]|nr:DNA helicase [Spirochaetia bacterium]
MEVFVKKAPPLFPAGPSFTLIAEIPTGGLYYPMRITADLHIHSRFSRATSSKLNAAYLDRWARIKGINLLGTGDCTHPKWLGELREQLDEAEPGFYTLKDEFRREFDAGAALAEGLPKPAAETCRFVLTGEISTIYKQGSGEDAKTRKVHHLVLLPDFKAAADFQTRLERVGNIRSDGRPILGVSSRDLLAMLLDTDDRSLLIPAHIWTPWFSALGAKSGFDSIDACYGDLAPNIPAVETGLSSNPPMNWALSALDRFAIISNSDAHSPEKLGREATVFEMEMNYASLNEALRAGRQSAAAAAPGAKPGIIETIEFFPQEGKYHYDGHRKCGVYLSPEAAIRADGGTGGLCPVCGKPMTRGVMGRVLELADRPVDETAPCPADSGNSNRRPYRSLIPLRELLGEILAVGPSAKKVDAAYRSLIEQTGSEFALLMEKDAAAIRSLRCPGLGGDVLAEAITRMRAGEVTVSPGYDGEYGTVRVFRPGAAIQAAGETGLFGELEGGTRSAKERALKKSVKSEKTAHANPFPLPTQGVLPPSANIPVQAAPPPKTFTPDEDQQAAITYDGPQAIIIAGPGTGKTAVLTARIARLIAEGRDPASILALTFTVKAAAELRERILKAVPGTSNAGQGSITAVESDAATRSANGAASGITAATFHSLCCAILREELRPQSPPPATGLSGGFTVLSDADRSAIVQDLAGTAVRKKGITADSLGKYIETRKRFLLLPGERRPVFPAASSPFLAALPELAESFGLDEANAEMETLYSQYRQHLRDRALLDFDDLPAGTVRLFAGNPAVLARYRSRYRHILVDEYQDLNFAQYVLIRLLAPNQDEAAVTEPPQNAATLRVIGDPNQAIYGFRGSDNRFIRRFLEDYPEARQFRLTRSFRCAAPIMDAAGRLADSRLAGADTPVNLYRTEYPTEKSEAEGIARRIAQLIGGTSFFAIDSNTVDTNRNDSVAVNNNTKPGVIDNSDTALGDCAILLRTAALAGPVIKALGDHGIPFALTGDHPWWEDEPVRSLLAELQETAKDRDTAPLEAVRAIWERMEREGFPGKIRKSRKAAPEIRERLYALASMYTGVQEFLDTLAVSESGDNSLGTGELKRDGVRVMTIHASKGLEFDQVFVIALEEGILPFTLYDSNPAQTERIEEEQRLLYVAMTRARRGLYVSWVKSRQFGSRNLKSGPSRFLAKLEDLIPRAEERKPQPVDSQLRLF